MDSRNDYLKIFFVYWLFTIVEANCGYDVTNNQGVVTTPNYPNKYGKDISCVWTITVGPGYYVQLTFDEFDVEPYADCKTDVLEIKDGGSINSPLIGGQYCNIRRPPKVLTSSSNEIRLWFSSDNTIQKTGFKVSYRAIKKETCGGLIEGTSGSIVSPRFPLHYPRDTYCEWRIKVPEGKYIALEFSFFKMESVCPATESCKCNDYIIIKDGGSNSSKQIGKYCLSAPPPMVTNSNEAIIQFVSDSYGRMKGFKALFSQSSTKKCGGDMFYQEGTIQSPNFNLWKDTTYPANSNCVWAIHTKKNHYISVRFQYLDVLGFDKSGKCESDYVEIRDGSNETALLIGRYCNTFQPKVILSSTETLYVRFVSGPYSDRKGFKISYLSHAKSCSSSLGMEDGRITSYQLQASSVFKIAHYPHALSANLGRLNGPFAWCSQEQKFDYIGEYLEVNFDTPTRISKIATQGYTMVGHFYFAEKFKVKYSLTGRELKHYANKLDSKLGNLYTVFEGNTKYNVSKINDFTPNVVVRTLRIVPLKYTTGRRKHVCLRMEAYGCRISQGVEIVKATKGIVKFSSSKKASKTWLMTSEKENSVYILKIKRRQPEKCRFSTLSSSYDGLTYVKEACVDNMMKIIPTSRQLWLKFDVFSTSSRIQDLEISHSTIVLGRGRLISSFLGKIHLVHNEVVTDTKPSVWLFHFPKGCHLKLEFTEINLPSADKVNPNILIKSGLEENSKTIRSIEGREGHWGFFHPKNVLRIEYHTGSNTGGSFVTGLYKDGFTLEYSAIKA